MKRRGGAVAGPAGLIAIALFAGLACSARTSPSSAPAPSAPSGRPTPVSVGEGESFETSVLVPARSETEGVAWENNWIYDHYGRFRKRSVGLATVSGRRYDVVTVELADHSERTIYCDITLFLGH